MQDLVSKSTRSGLTSETCVVPRSLALCEIHLAVVALALRVLPQMKLFETTEEDVLYDHDMFIPMTKASSKGIRVVVS
jgi:hypothetical protein